VVDEPGQCRGQQVDLDVLTASGLLAPMHGGEQADHCVQSGHDVEHRDAGPVRRPIRVARQAHQP
jgi:hypothetical protein